MSELIKQPSVLFYQGDPFGGGADVEYPIQIVFWNGSVELRQDKGDTKDEIILSPKHIDALFKTIKKHLPEAEKIINKK